MEGENMKICVYAICKNEEKFVQRWYDSMKEADKIFVLDTGSTDGSYDALKKLGVIVKKEEIKPWRFDVARNISLDMVDEDTDICVCTDLDEVFEEGWRDKLEKMWKEDTTRASYTYNWSLDDSGNPIISFYSDKMHSRHGYRWTRPVHEVLAFDGVEKRVFDETLVLNHYPDRSKSRGSYLPLLELSVKDLMSVLKGSITENHIIVITGGEPFMQLEELRELLEILLNEDLYDRVVIETSASVQIPDFVMSTVPAVKLNISPKKNMAVQPLYWDYFRVNEFRFAVDNSSNGQNIEWVYSLLKQYPSIRRRANGNLYLSPIIHDDLSSEENWKWVNEVADYCNDSGEFKFSMQIHKLLGIK